jgi:hypothetical protein
VLEELEISTTVARQTFVWDAILTKAIDDTNFEERVGVLVRAVHFWVRTAKSLVMRKSGEDGSPDNDIVAGVFLVLGNHQGQVRSWWAQLARCRETPVERGTSN